MKTLFFTLLTFYFFIETSCQNIDSSNKEKIIIPEKENKLINKITIILEPKDDDNVITFYYHDSLFNGHQLFITEDTTIIESDVSIFLIAPNKNQSFFYLSPGDTVKLDNSNYLSPNIKNITNKNIIEPNFFNLLIQNYGRIWSFATSLEYHQKVKNKDDFRKNLAEIKTKYAKCKLFLDSSKNAGSISLTFQILANKIILDASRRDSLLAFWNNRNIPNIQNELNSLVNRLIITTSEEDYNSNFISNSLLNNLVSSKYSTFIAHSISNTHHFEQRTQAILANFSGIYKDYLLSNTLASLINLGIPYPNKYLAEYKINCENKSFISQIETLIQNKNKTIDSADIGKDLVFNTQFEKKELKEIIELNKGKIILLDFWASWCMPCRAEFPFIAKLNEKYKNQPFKVIGLSTDADNAAWEKAIKSKQITWEQFLIANPKQSPIIRSNKINAIPRYILIGKDGKVISADAPRPSEAGLITKINKYLKK